MTDERVLGVDVGGTAIKVVSIGADGDVRERPGVPTPRDDRSGRGVVDAVEALVAAEPGVAAVGLAIPGIVDEEAGVCRASVNLGWRELPLRDLVAARLGVPVALSQDVRAGARAERATGAGAGRPGGLLFAALGTGLATAALDEDGRPVGGVWAGEVGQLRWTDGPHAGLRVEQVASAGGLAARFGVAEARAVADAVRAGDERAARLWAETADALAEVLAWCVAVTSPATVVVGGGLARSGGLLLDPVRRSLAARLTGFPAPVLLPAAHGTAAAAVGAAQLAAAR